MPPDKVMIEQYVCPDCFNDEALKRIAHANAVRSECGFCDCRSSVPIAAPLDVLVASVRDGLQWCYTTDTQQVEFDDEGRPLVQLYTTRSLLGDVDWLNPGVLPPIRNAKLLEEVVRAIGDTEWYSLTLTPEIRFGRLTLSWADFCWRITEGARFFFFARLRGDAVHTEPHQFPTVTILDELADLVRSANLVRIPHRLWGLFLLPGGDVLTLRNSNPNHLMAEKLRGIRPAGSSVTRTYWVAMPAAKQSK
jgi:hypothetical protein